MVDDGVLLDDGRAPPHPRAVRRPTSAELFSLCPQYLSRPGREAAEDLPECNMQPTFPSAICNLFSRMQYAAYFPECMIKRVLDLHAFSF